MSYPNLIQPLIIEDDRDSRDLYDAAFKSSINDGIMEKPRYACNFDDAIQEINSNKIFHFVILDLRLPELVGQSPSNGVDYGLALLERCINRDNYPIPCLIIISGKIAQTEQSELDERVRKGFYYGRMLVKNTNMENELLKTVEKVRSYLSIGIHQKDSGERSFPTLSPRDEDLLRRCALEHSGCIGLDLDWWSAEYQSSDQTPVQFSGWTKVLVGNFLFNNGDCHSRPNFFKLAPAGGANYILTSAKRIGYKLSHIKVQSDIVADSRYLLVTEKVGSSPTLPISLEQFLLRPSSEVQEVIPKITNDIVQQVSALGDCERKESMVKDLLWKHHDYEKISEQWEKYGAEIISEKLKLKFNPLEVYKRLSSDENYVWYQRQSSLHGDLNITNIALDVSEEDVQAFIFDSEGGEGNCCIRDLAMFEVTALLHQQTQGNIDLVNLCRLLYKENSFSEFEQEVIETDQASNTFHLISEIRKQALKKENNKFIYALMVFDNALIQLGGLWFAVSRNKIINPISAAILAALVAQWVLSTKSDAEIS